MYGLCNADQRGRKCGKMMLSEKTRKRVEMATVRLTKKNGQGVIVQGGLILTAAHCVEASIEGEMALGDFFLQEVECGGHAIVTQVLAVEPVSDIAVLGMPDDQSFYKEANDYEKVLNLIEPIELRFNDIEQFREIPAMIFTHRKTWLQANVQKCNESTPLLFVTGADIEQGTSGGPVIDKEGLLLGIVSTCGGPKSEIPDKKDYCAGHLAWASHALPVWIVERVKRGAELV